MAWHGIAKGVRRLCEVSTIYDDGFVVDVEDGDDVP